MSALQGTQGVALRAHKADFGLPSRICLGSTRLPPWGHKRQSELELYGEGAFDRGPSADPLCALK